MVVVTGGGVVGSGVLIKVGGGREKGRKCGNGREGKRTGSWRWNDGLWVCLGLTEGVSGRAMRADVRLCLLCCTICLYLRSLPAPSVSHSLFSPSSSHPSVLHSRCVFLPHSTHPPIEARRVTLQPSSLKESEFSLQHVLRAYTVVHLQGSSCCIGGFPMSLKSLILVDPQPLSPVGS